ncbi:integral membrane protein TerC family-domain-containing protein [Pavlovales sp. CCMP2436]|nr:integral membrane protein TerC family-domain-containing protein [Pavlovales sp. CCMP2436]
MIGGRNTPAARTSAMRGAGRHAALALVLALAVVPALQVCAHSAPDVRRGARQPHAPSWEAPGGTHRVHPGRRSSARMLELRGGRAESTTMVSEDYQNAIKWTIITMSSAVAFGLGIIPFKGKDASIDFFTGFLIEKILSIDNLFVFVMLFDAFKTPEKYQRKVLTIGIYSAIVLRGIMIAVGVGLVQRCRPVLLAFAGILILSSLKMMRESIRPHEEEDLGSSGVVKLASKLVGATADYDGSKFFTVKNGKWCAFLLLFFLAVAHLPPPPPCTVDILLARAVKDLVHLKLAVSIILGFVGVKMCLDFANVHISSLQSLLTVGAILLAGVLASLAENRSEVPVVRIVLYDMILLIGIQAGV